jgi:hypothetical protein
MTTSTCSLSSRPRSRPLSEWSTPSSSSCTGPIGKAILDRQSAEGWGAKVVDQLAVDRSLAFPDSQGFSRRNLHYMRRLAEAWPGPEFVPQLVAQIPWGHPRVLLDRIEEPDARDW